MKTIDCDVILDLLPLYIDEVCSKSSKELVEDHLSFCDSCKKACQTYKETLTIPPYQETLKEIKPFKKMNRMIKLLIITLVIVLFLPFGVYYYMSYKGYPIPMIASSTIKHSLDFSFSNPVHRIENISFDNYLIHVVENQFSNSENNYYEINGYHSLIPNLYRLEIIKGPIRLSENQIYGGTFTTYQSNIGYILGLNVDELNTINVHLSNNEILSFDATNDLFFIPFNYPQNTTITKFEALDSQSKVCDTFIPGEDQPAEFDTMSIDGEGNITYEKSIYDEDGNYMKSEVIPFEN